MSVDAVMADLQDRVRERLREQLLRHGASKAFEDPLLFAEVERLLTAATEVGESNTLILAQLLGEPGRWRLETAMRYRSHRGNAAASLILFVKRHVLMPVLRWLFEYSRDNFERQRRVNQVLFACVQELAVEAAQLRKEVRRLSDPSADSTGSGSTGSGVEPSASSGRPEPIEGR